MNPGQTMFYQFIMDRVKDENKAEMEALLTLCFAKQDEGTFDKAYLLSIMPQMLAAVKPEAIEELNQAMAHFSSQLQ